MAPLTQLTKAEAIANLDTESFRLSTFVDLLGREGELETVQKTFAMAKGGGADVGPTKRGKGLNIMAIVDRHGLPLSVSTHAANHHEVRLVQLCFDFYMIEAKPENLIGDRAYDSDLLDVELRRDGIEMIAPHRSNRSRPATQDGRRLRRYARRWVVERFFAWVQWQRPILVRWEYYPQNFLGFRDAREIAEK
jgi:IS5 family transposase